MQVFCDYPFLIHGRDQRCPDCNQDPGSHKSSHPIDDSTGLLAAPLAFSVARGMHKGAMEALSVATDAAGGPSPFLIASIKGLEYGLLGFALSAVQKQSWGGALACTVVGLAAGVLFGGAILFFSIEAAAGPIPHSALIARAVNEILFPVGCALVIFSAEVLGKQLPK